MGLQDQLIKTLKFFTKGKLTNSKVYVHAPIAENLHTFSVVITGTFNTKAIKSSSSGREIYITFLKALSELGEIMISQELNLENRSGVAGGLVNSNSVLRAKAELIERDAFLFHYRNMIPFKQVRTEKEFFVYDLLSIDPDFHVNFVMSPSYLSGENSCLVYGLGCGETKVQAFQKAFLEYSSMKLNHSIDPCTESEQRDPVMWKRKVDFHHNESRSKENKNIFNILCNNSLITVPSREYSKSLWQIVDLKSPLRFFKFVKAHHPHLETLHFGQKESTFTFDNQVYHPLW